MKNTIALALIASIGTASIASAAATSSYFGYQGDQAADSVVNIDLVVSEANGTVEIYDYRLGVQGALLASDDVRAGANTDLKLGTNLAPIGDVIAVLKSDSGEVLATQEFDIERF